MPNRTEASTPFCSLPFENLVVYDPQHFRPCYRMAKIKTDKPLAPNEMFLHPSMQQVRESFQQGHWPAFCETCRVQEASQRSSTRMRLSKTRENTSLREPKIQSLDLNFSNQCQGVCRLCSSSVSSGWYALDKELHDLPENPFHRGAFPPKNDFPLLNIDDFRQIKVLEFSSSEVFEQSKTRAFIQKLSMQTFAGGIRLKIMTTLASLPSEQWLQCLCRFANVDIFLSIDGVGKANEYLRHPLKWDGLVQNLHALLDFAHKQDSITPHLHTAITAYNLFELDSLHDWWQSMGLSNTSHVLLSHPYYLAPHVLPQKVLDEAIAYCKSFNLAQALGKPHNFSEDAYSLFLRFTHFLDQKQGQNLQQALPILHQLIANDFAKLSHFVDPVAPTSYV
ncbi:MAG: twitch domain-containing radical SAM protein [Bdellovibrionales bacterium]|nr:twitch domain-containing radical SAM protein [Bdellovibrionales bacterium]